MSVARSYGCAVEMDLLRSYRVKSRYTPTQSQRVQAHMQYAEGSGIRTMMDRCDDRGNPSIQSAADHLEKSNETGTNMVRH